MAKYRTLKMSMWSDPFVEELTPMEKLLYIFLITSHRTDNLGVLEISHKRISIETGIEVDEVATGIKTLKKAGKVLEIDGMLWIVKFISNQTSTSQKIILGLRSLFENLESPTLQCEIKKEYPDIFEDCEIKDRVSRGIKGYQGVCIPIEEREVELEVEVELEKEMEREEEGEYERECEKETKTAAIPPCPHKKIVSLYAEILPELRQVREWNTTRQRYLQARWSDDPERQTLDWWRNFFESIRKMPFLMGKVDQNNGRPPFQADLEWMIRPTNFVKIIEGKYLDKGQVRMKAGRKDISLEDYLKEFRDNEQDTLSLRDDMFGDKGVTQDG